MKLVVPIAVRLAGAILLSAPAVAQGVDSCASPTVISGVGPHAFDTTAATTGAEGQANGGCLYNGSTAIENDVWFAWTASASGTAILSFCQQTLVDTKVAVYPAAACPATVPVACDDDGCGVQSLTWFGASAGQTFVIQVGNAPFAAGGTGTFTIHMSPSASSDDCSTPTVIGGTGEFPFDNRLAGGTGPANPGCVTVKSNVWYAWTAPISGMARLELCGRTALDSNIAVYAGSGCPVSTSLACDDDACGLQSLVTWPVSAGVVYALEVGSSSSASTGFGTFLLDVTAPPVNDLCASASPLAGGGAGFDNTLATTGAEGQGNPCGGIDQDLWYTWTASVNGTATVDTCFQTGVDTSLAVYAGASCPAGVALACNDDGASCAPQSDVTFPVSAGASYTIQVGCKPGASPGAGSFSLVETPGGGPSTPYCFGDGTGGACPCGNNGASGQGCANSADPNGALLVTSGNASVSADSLLLDGSGMPPGTTVIYLQGTLPLPNGIVLGDGLRCVTGALIRLGVESNSGAGSSSYGGPAGDIPVSVRGLLPASGGTRDYQAWYRNPASFCTPATYNLSNGVEVVWAP